MKKYKFLFLLIVLFQNGFAQSNSSWKGYFSYNEIIDVEGTTGKIFSATQNTIFSKTINSSELSIHNSVTGFKPEFITAIHHSETTNKIFAGNTNGLLVIINSDGSVTAKVDIINEVPVAPNKKKINDLFEHNGRLYIATDYGISVLEKVNNKWVFRNKINGFDYSSRYFEITNSLDVYVSHEYKGVFRLKLDDKFFKTNKFITYQSPKKGKNASLVKFNNQIYYAYKDGILKLNSKTNEFEKDKLLSSVFENDEYTSGKMIVDYSNKIWLFSKNYIHYFTLSKLSSDLKQNNIPIPAALTNSMSGFENINQISNYGYLIGTTDGYYTMNINDLSFKNYNVSISNISVNKINETSFFAPITEEGEFKHEENNITFNYTVPEYNKY